MMFDHWGYGGPGLFGMGWGMLLFWALLIVGLVAFVRVLALDQRGPTHPPEGRTALEILSQRYARGEISREEFEQKQQDLAR